jgi:hypothetical protein
MNNTRTDRRYEFAMFRPKCPEGWTVLEHRENIKNSYIPFYRWAKTHHNGEPERVIAVFHEFNPEYVSNYRYTVRGGRKCKPNEDIKYFSEFKDAQAYLLYIMESTDKWIEEINSQSYIDAYNAKIAKAVSDNQRRLKSVEE